MRFQPFKGLHCMNIHKKGMPKRNLKAPRYIYLPEKETSRQRQKGIRNEENQPQKFGQNLCPTIA
jgi:hypothetical protein